MHDKISVDIYRQQATHDDHEFCVADTGLYADPLALLAYFTIGKKSTHKKMMDMKTKGMKMKKLSGKTQGWRFTLRQWLYIGRYNCRNFIAVFYYFNSDKYVN
jgi:hypothetical protein